MSTFTQTDFTGNNKATINGKPVVKLPGFSNNDGMDLTSSLTNWDNVPKLDNSNMMETPLGNVGGTSQNILSKTATGFKNIFGFNDQKPSLVFPEQGASPDDLAFINSNNQAVLTDAQQSLSKWNAFGNVMQGISGAGNLYLGFQQLDLAKDTARLQKKAFEINLANQTKSYNTQIAERHERFLKRSGTYSKEALKSYMDKHGL